MCDILWNFIFDIFFISFVYKSWNLEKVVIIVYLLLVKKKFFIVVKWMLINKCFIGCICIFICNIIYGMVNLCIVIKFG